ncbi:MAG TPA: substrate-binding domain-containing protein [Candidatus Borkfalkia faecavium]|uniref:Substrate-binding domain-containing protein n=1 Tax=Candidatus Borkfalkia faecavium TaxID=2838508 RepID=A0A9D1W043_9FIRM|nr:substrate-binding domain-containing protein [Candidatus Borkfalkia faecavium]
MKKIIMAVASAAVACCIGFAAVGCGGVGEYLVNVSGGGSGVGISQAKSGQVEMGMASSKVEGEDAEGIEVYAICQDGIAVIVNNANELDNLTTDQLNAIYTGEITDWSEIEGATAEGEIAVGQREDGSGTRDAFLELIEIEDATTLVEAANTSNSTSALMEYVAGNEQAIGYISLGSLDETVSAVNINGVEATTDNVLEGKYTLARPFNVMYQQATMDSNDLLADFFTFLKSAQAHDIIVEEGYVSGLASAPEYKVPETLPTTSELDIAGSTSVQPLMGKLAEAYTELLNNALNADA